ncbi:MAG TPA: helix-turn-helix transcriptional regulator [Acidimicrobiales bacterium]|nr:helix-turn-helix transcriptional regulator [Acidimicrobiales bacterium]
MSSDTRGQLELLLLRALQVGPAHGYAIIERIRSRSGGVFDLAEGSVYPALHALEGAGLLKSRWAEERGRGRRTYELTAKGERRLAQLTGDYRRFARGMVAVLEGTQ